jgi:hypothetical protein
MRAALEIDATRTDWGEPASLAALANSHIKSEERVVYDRRGYETPWYLKFDAPWKTLFKPHSALQHIRVDPQKL